MEHHGERSETIIFVPSKAKNYVRRRWMKNSRPAKPTRSQKESIKKAGFSWENWLVVSEDTFMLTIVNKTSGIKKRIKK